MLPFKFKQCPIVMVCVGTLDSIANGTDQHRLLLHKNIQDHNQSPIRRNPKLTHSNDIFENVPTCNPLFIFIALTHDARMKIGATNHNTKGIMNGITITEVLTLRQDIFTLVTSKVKEVSNGPLEHQVHVIEIEVSCTNKISFGM